MKAAVFHAARQPLAMEEIPTPTPSAGEVLVKVAGCGVCHTDLHYIDHDVPTFKKPPLVLGHEVSGMIAGLGAGVAQWKEGARVLLPAVYGCGQCAMCRTGRENICEKMMMFGNNVDGGYAEYVLAPAKDVIPLPDELPLVESSIIADAVTTPYHAVVNRGQVKPGDSVVVVGCGGIGLNLVQVASAVGAKVIAVDVIDSKLEWAKKLGAQATVNASASTVLALPPTSSRKSFATRAARPTPSRARATPRARLSRAHSACAGPAIRTRFHLNRSMRRSFSRRLARLCRKRCAPCARADASFAPAST